jgi:Flp pilus assembly protein TadG
MNLRRPSLRRPSLPRRLVGLVRDERGVSAVEFAMILPLMLTLYLGAVEISQGVAIDRKVTLTTRTVADLTSQAQTVLPSDVSNILNASAQVIMPYDASKLKVTVSQVKIDANSNATIDWSCTLNGTKHGVGSGVTLPAALAVANTYLIWSEVSYSYKPTIGYVISGTLNLSDQIYMRPRLSNSVTLNGTC